MGGRILIIGGTGFVGSALLPALQAAGYDVTIGSRHARKGAGAPWVQLDVNDSATLPHALAGVDTVYYLVHGMSDRGDFAQREQAAARNLVSAAAQAGVRRIIYLGGVVPDGPTSPHLESRRVVGELLRTGPVPAIELRAAVIIGAGSASWNIIRDLAARLPLMVLPKWLDSRLSPVALPDVVAALVRASEIPVEQSTLYDLPGPEVLQAKELLLRAAALRGLRPVTVSVPVLSPWLSSWWIRLVTRERGALATSLVEGLRGDLLPSAKSIWPLLSEDYRPMALVRAMELAARHEFEALPVGSLFVEALALLVARRPTVEQRA